MVLHIFRESFQLFFFIEKTFSDIAQYFHSKHLKNGPKRHEKHFFQWNGVLGPKRYFPKYIASFSFIQT